MLSTLLNGNLWLYYRQFYSTDTLEDAQEAMDETPVDIAKQSVPDEDSGDEIIHGNDGINVLAEVKLPSTIRKSAQILI